MTAEDMVKENIVPPCMSTVYVKARPLKGDPTRIRYDGFCDTPTIKGVVAILVALFSGKTPREVVDLDTDQMFSELQLFEHLSPTRHVGVYAIVEKMKAQARAFCKPTRHPIPTQKPGQELRLADHHGVFGDHLPGFIR